MTQQITGSIYDYPNLYDVLFSDMCRSEMKFILSILDHHVGKQEGASLFEPACGSGRLLCQLAKCGFDVAGLDLNPYAVAFCNRRLKRAGWKESAIVGNMVAFSLADLGRTKKFDVAFNFVSSFLHLTTEEEAKQHLHAVAEVLKPNGIYLLGIHLKPKGKQHCLQERWNMRRGLLSIKSCLKSLLQDTKKRIDMIEWCVEAETPKKHYKVLDRFPLRIYSAKQFTDLLTAVNRFEIQETYSFDYDISKPIKLTSGTEDVVFALRVVTEPQS
ncbi:MAG: class I SAM-dependent methyltransferase [Planctomycetaceae bacterium]|nr:class I SAM-dependent methyltransferase [Planctomycetaceae bacterium]